MPGVPWNLYGNGRLATAAYAEISEAADADGSISTKYPWWGTRPLPMNPLTIVGQRLEELTPLMTLRAHEGFATRVNEGLDEGNPRARFWSSMVTFPTPGCWRLTGRVGRVRLSVVVLVRQAEKSAD
jgi:hypothetical protein